MKGVILAGGKGTRLEPLTEITNKHLLPVGREPMIWHPVKQLASAGITDILVITSTQHMGDVVNSLGSGKRFGCEFTYKVQEEAGGIAHALALAERFANGEKIAVLLGDNIFQYSLAPHVQAFREQGEGARVLLKEVGDPERYGVAALDERQVIEIEEKPQRPKSCYAVVGCYMYDHQVFDLIRQVKPSERGEMEITAVNNLYIKKGQLQYSFVRGSWMDAGTFESWFEANRILLETNNRVME
ncbi:MAG: sugar phosphate nucleotidyltransferase [Bacillota bacterium]